MRRGNFPKAVFALLVSALLTACGGGSGTTAGGTTGGGTTGGGDTVTPPVPTLTIALVRDVDGTQTAVTRIDPSRPATVVATIANATTNAVVSFSATLGQFSPVSATALSSNGEARIILEAGTAAGAGQVTASTTVDGLNLVSNAVAYEVLEFEEVQENLQLGLCNGGLDCSGGATFTPGSMLISLDTVVGEPTTGLAAQGTAEISFVVGDLNATTGAFTPLSGISVNITSRCTNLSVASISEEQSDASGVVTATYQAEAGCENNDSITAVEPSTGSSATGSILVFPPRVGSIIFDSVVDSLGEAITTIFIQESGGESTARVIFQVLDRAGTPKPDQDVRFELTTNIGDLALQNTVRKTDAEGKAVAFVNSGFIATTVRVRASLDIDTDNDGINDTTLVTLSDQLSVNTGIADQDSMSIAATNLNVEGEDRQGTTTAITVLLSDAFNNPVRDGTTVQFRTEYGSIQPACNTVGGGCSVTWTSSEPRRQLDINTPPPLLSESNVCPDPLVTEIVTISGGQALTQYKMASASFNRVETLANVELGQGTDFTVIEDGLVCEATSALCTEGTTLTVTYARLWLDEDADGDTNHTISNPGVATAPFTLRTGVPCLAPSRSPTMVAAGYNGGLGQLYGGRSTILAFAQGEESFTDTNGNGLYDVGEPFVDLPEAFLDVNDDGVFGSILGNPGVDGDAARGNALPTCYGPTVPLANNPDTNGDGLPDLNNCYQEGGDEDVPVDFNDDGKFNAGNGIYNGTLCPLDVADNPNICSGKTCTDKDLDLYCTRTLVNIRKSIRILSAGSFASIGVRDAVTGEYVSSVSLTGNPAVGTFDSDVPLFSNDGNVIAAGDDFTIGYRDTQVSPGVGQVANLRTSSGGLLVDIADMFNGRMPVGSDLLFSSAACQIDNVPLNLVPNSSANGFTTVFLALGAAENPTSASGAVTVTVAPEFAAPTAISFSCAYDDDPTTP